MQFKMTDYQSSCRRTDSIRAMVDTVRCKRCIASCLAHNSHACSRVECFVLAVPHHLPVVTAVSTDNSSTIQ